MFSLFFSFYFISNGNYILVDFEKQGPQFFLKKILKTFFYEPTGTDQRLKWTGITAMWDAAYAGFATGGGHLVDNQQMTGIKFYAGSGNIGFKWIKIYGMK